MPERVKSAFRIALLPAWVMVLSCGCGGGVDRSKDPSTDDRPVTQPADLLRLVFVKYRNVDTYRDNAVATLSYRSGGRSRTRTAPLAVRYDRRELYVAAYGVRLWLDDQASLAWLVDPTDDPSTDTDVSVDATPEASAAAWEGQVLSLPAGPGRPDPATLLTDDVIAARITAGLAGPPPQLDWLFSVDPMAKLFDSDARYQYLPTARVDDATCLPIRVDQDGDTFVFYVDRSAALVRRVELPGIEIVDPETGQPGRVELSIAMRDATFDPPAETVAGPTLEGFPTRPFPVSKLIPPPSTLPPWLDRSTRSWRLARGDGKWLLDQGRSDRDATLLIFAIADPASDSIQSQLLSVWERQMPAEVRRRMRIIRVTGPTRSDQARTAPDPPPGIDGVAVVDTQQAAAMGVGVTLLDARGRIVWNEPRLTPDRLPGLGVLIADVIGGVDVPQRLRDQHDQEVAAYRNELQRHSVR